MAAALCIGGACKYVLKESCGVTDDWLLETVAPNILLQFPREVALTLARPLLWAVFEPHLQGYLPDTLTERVRSAYAFVRRLPAAANPVEKIPIIITGAEGEVYIDEIGADLDQGVCKVVPQGEQPPAGGAQRRLAGQQRNVVLGLYSLQKETQRDMKEMQAQIVVLKSAMQKGMTKLNTSLNRLTRMSWQRFKVDGLKVAPTAAPPTFNDENFEFQAPGVNNNQNDNELQVENEFGFNVDVMVVEPKNHSSLSKTPKTLFVLWQEFEVGIGGRKPARLFTRVERGRVKCLYCRRKVLWEAVARLVRAGFTAHVAIDRIYEAYGVDKTVSQIINQMMKDRRNGGHPLLQV